MAISDMADCFTVILASLTIIITLWEYREHRKRIRAEVLGQYNERYSRDEHINKVVDYIIRYMDGEYIINKPSTHDAEMFMRFFEEMQIQIDKNRLEKEQVFDLFAYYAMVFDANEKIRDSLGIIDYDNGEWLWSIFKKFATNMMIHYHLKNYKWSPKQSLDKCNSNDKSNIVKVNLVFNKSAIIFKKMKDLRIIKNHTYKQGIIYSDTDQYTYVFSGSNKPDELHYKSKDKEDIIVYVGEFVRKNKC